VNKAATKEDSWVSGCTAKQLMHTMQQLASNPVLRRQVEAELQAETPAGFSFHIDEYGIGHLWGAKSS
jgi:hypothetical protein